jgi:hypothetical protein
VAGAAARVPKVDVAVLPDRLSAPALASVVREAREAASYREATLLFV